MSTPPSDNREEHLELPFEDLPGRARPLPPHEEMVVENLGDEEGAAFLAVVES